MIETPERVIAFLGDLRRQYLSVKFALMPAGEWFLVLRARPDAEVLVARVRCLPEAVVEYLSSSSNLDVRGIVASRAALFAGVQHRLVSDPDVAVRFRLAAGRGTLSNILIVLATDAIEEVRSVAQRRIVVGQGRVDDRESRSRSRRYWGTGHFPLRIVRALDRETYRAALMSQHEHCQQMSDARLKTRRSAGIRRLPGS